MATVDRRVVANRTVDVWLFDLRAGASSFEACHGSLSHDERARADRFVSDVHRRRYVIGRGRLRAALSAYLDAAPGGIVLSTAEGGKPRLEASTPLRFNLSHTGDLAALAVMEGHEVGIDIEAVASVEPGLEETVCAPLELSALEKLGGADRIDAFYRLWTRKEAVLKALGSGLLAPVRSFAVSLEHNVQPCVVWSAPDFLLAQRCTLVHLEPGAGVAGALAIVDFDHPPPIVNILTSPGGVAFSADSAEGAPAT